LQDTPKNFHKKLLGKVGEKNAEKYLKKLGYKIIAVNKVTPFGEIDIVAKDNDYTVFIEVKTRLSSSYGEPAEAVDYIKRKHLINSARYYISENKLFDTPIRFDVVEVFGEEKKINHIENAFET